MSKPVPRPDEDFDRKVMELTEEAIVKAGGNAARALTMLAESMALVILTRLSDHVAEAAANEFGQYVLEQVLAARAERDRGTVQ